MLIRGSYFVTLTYLGKLTISLGLNSLAHDLSLLGVLANLSRLYRWQCVNFLLLVVTIIPLPNLR